MTMETQAQTTSQTPRREPWNKGKLIGQKPPFRPKHVWSIRTRLQMDGRVRDLAMFNLAIDSKLRGCDVVALRVDDIAPSGYTVDRATVRQKKTGRPVRFELTEQTRQAVDDYIRGASKEAWGISVHRPARCGTKHHAPTIRTAGVGLDRDCRARRQAVWHALPTTHQGDLNLS